MQLILSVLKFIFRVCPICGGKKIIQDAAERTPRFGRGIASDGERVQWWGARHRTAVYVPFSVYAMAWLGEHRAFIVHEFIKNGGSPVATQRAFPSALRLVDGRLFLIIKRFTVGYQTLDKQDKLWKL